jgi:rubrerythrin
MLDNYVYDLINQLVQESQSLLRVKREYITDAGQFEECKEFWERLAKDKEKHIEELEKLLTKHIQKYFSNS